MTTVATLPASAPLCFVDTETDGVHPSRRPWEIAVIRREPDGTAAEWRSYVDIDLSTADPFGLRVGRFYDRHPLGRHLAHGDDWSIPSFADSDYLSAREAAHEVAKRTHGAHVVGCVPNFDTDVLAGLLRAEGLTPAWHYHLCDVENLTVGFLAGRGEPIAPPWSSDDLGRALGVEPPAEDERHTALGDARWAMRLYDAVMAGGPR